MKSTTPAASPDAYVAALTGWQRTWVAKLRKAVRAPAELEERIDGVIWSTSATVRCC